MAYGKSEMMDANNKGTKAEINQVCRFLWNILELHEKTAEFYRLK